MSRLNKKEECHYLLSRKRPLKLGVRGSASTKIINAGLHEQKLDKRQTFGVGPSQKRSSLICRSADRKRRRKTMFEDSQVKKKKVHRLCNASPLARIDQEDEEKMMAWKSEKLTMR